MQEKHYGPLEWHDRVWLSCLCNGKFFPLQAEENPWSFAGQGIMVGEVTESSALVQLRLTRADKLEEGKLPGQISASALY